MQSSSIRGLLFDKDGTLFHHHKTWDPWAEAFIERLSDGDQQLKQVLATAMEFDLDTGSFLSTSPFIAGTADELINALTPHLPSVARTDLVKLYETTVQDVDLAPAVPLQPLLADLKSRGLYLGVSTNDMELAARAHLARARVEEAFDFIAGYDSGYGGKPAPGMQQAFCKQLDLDPGEVAMVGDSRHDLLAGENAGMIRVAVLTGTATHKDLAPFADVVLPHIGHIPGWLEGN